MFDSLKQLSQLGPMMAKAKEMQRKMEEVKAKLPSLRATAAAGGGMVTVTVSGTLEVLSVRFSQGAMIGDADSLGFMTKQAINDALQQMQQQVQQEMQAAAGDMDLSQFKGMLGG